MFELSLLDVCVDNTLSHLSLQDLDKLPQPPSTVAVLPHNKAHNRFNNIFPCELLLHRNENLCCTKHVYTVKCCCFSFIFMKRETCLLSFSSDDKSRVCLKETPGMDSCDYINASFIDVRKNFHTHENCSNFCVCTGIWGKKECLHYNTRYCYII